jgi:hypothetical protein
MIYCFLVSANIGNGIALADFAALTGAYLNQLAA